MDVHVWLVPEPNANVSTALMVLDVRGEGALPFLTNFAQVYDI
jgi:hypothetical protein